MSATRLALACLVLMAPVAARSGLVPCRDGAAAERISDALGRIRRSIDPCGESAEVTAMLARLEGCVGYEVCTSATADRNLFAGRTITWNPQLRSEIEPACEGDLAAPIRRDPTASLLHELVHAVHECEGLEPGEHELEAVRIENIYRRAAGLCQRTRYGDVPLPRSMMRMCGRNGCACSEPELPVRADAPQAASTDGRAADSTR